MGRRIFWIFILFVSSVTLGMVLYIQSEAFARLAKGKIQRTVSRELGAEINFDRLRVGILPPSLSLVNVELKITSAENALGLAPSAVFKAGRVGFSFRMIQAFSRGISVNKLFLSDGEVRFELPKDDGKSSKEKLSDLVHKPIQIRLGENFYATIRQLEVRNTVVALKWIDSGKPARVSVDQVQYLAVTPAKEGTNLVANLENVQIDLPSLKDRFKAVRLNADVEKSRIFLSSLDLQRREAALHAAGKLVGSVDRLEDARPDIDVILRSPFSELADFEKSLSSYEGEILADLKIVGRIRDPAVQGKVAVNGFRYSLWSLDKIEVQGSYASGSIVADSVVVQRNGGTLSLKNQLEVPLPLRAEPLSLQLRFADAKFEDFAGDLLKDVNNLRLTLSGTLPVRLDFTKENGKVKLGALTLKPELTIKDLELNNQSYGKKKDYHKIFRLAPFHLSGNLGWKGGEVRVNEGKLAFASGAVDVKGSVSEKGYDIHGSSEKINMGKEVGEIGDIPVFGEGEAKVHVRGPNKAVFIDFDLKQKNAKFLDFDFGDIDGRVTYDDQGSYIYIAGLRGKKNSSAYSVDGKVNVGDGDDISLSASFDESDPNDLFAIFAKQVEKISWIPHGMGGKLRGKVKVGGGYSGALSTLEIDSLIQGKNLNYKGELVHEAEVNAGVRKGGTIFAKNLKARKHDTIFNGEIDYFPNDEMKYRLAAENGKLRSLDFLTSAGLPIDGLIRFKSEGKGKWETLESHSKVEVRNAFIRTMPLPPADIVFDTHADHSVFEAAMGDTIEMKVLMAAGAKGDSYADFSFDETNMSYVLCLLNKRLCADPSLSMRLDASGRFAWKGGAWKDLSGQISAKTLQIAKSGFQLSNAAPFMIRAQGGMLESGKVTFEGEDSRLVAQLRGKVDGSAADNTLNGNVSLRVLEFVTPLIEEARGKFGVDMRITGGLQEAKFGGSLAFLEGFLRLNGLDAPLENLTGKIKFNGNRATVDGLNGQIGGGSAQVTGGFDLYLNKPPKFELDILLANNRLKFFPVNFAEFSEAKLSFTGDAPPYLFGGTAKVKRVIMRNNFEVGAQKALQNARYLPEKLGGAKSLYEIRIRAIAEGGVFVQNDLLDAEFKGEVTLLNNFEFPQIIARAELVRGKLMFRTTAFTLDHAFIRAPNPEFFNPQFSIGGIANVDSYRISIFASGTIDKPKITLSSSPSLPQEDIISLLAFGYRGEDARRVNPGDTSALTYSEVGSILLEQLKLSQNLQSKGVRLRVAPSISDNEANIIRPNSTAGAVSPKVYLQTQIMKNLEATFGSTVGATQGQEVDANLEYRLGKKASVSAVYEQEPSLDVTKKKDSYGADLKFRWGFK